MITTGLEELLKTAAPIPATALRSAWSGAKRFAVPGAALGAGLGAMNPGRDEQGNQRSALSGAMRGGLGGALAGGVAGGAMGYRGHAPAALPGPRPQAALPASPSHGLGDAAPWLKDVRTQADARSAYHAQARQAHPDAGGSTQAFQNLGSQWTAARQHPDFVRLGFDLGAQTAFKAYGLAA